MDPNSLKKINAACKQRRAAILLTELESGRDRVIVEGDQVAGGLGEIVQKSFQTGRSAVHEIEGKEFFLNVYSPQPRIAVIGAVHISQALAGIAKIAGFQIRVIDPRTAFATPERFEGVDLIAQWPEQAFEEMALDEFTALVAVTHDPKIDDFALINGLNAGCFYVGALGSRKTHAKRLERLQKAGMDKQALERIHAPIGLAIGAANPREIAVAIMAEIIQMHRKREIVI